MENLTAAKADVKKVYDAGNNTQKALIRKLFPKESFDKGIMDKVKTFEDACKIKKISPKSIELKGLTKDEIAYRKLKIIAEVLNEGWKPDWMNSNESKWWPWFYLNVKSGLGLSFVGVDGVNSASAVGSRLCFKSRELAEYVAKQFTAIYGDYLK